MTTCDIHLIVDRIEAADSLKRALKPLGCLPCVSLRSMTTPGSLDAHPDPLVLLHDDSESAGILAWCRDLRKEKPEARICLVFESHDETKMVVALEMGADATLVRPFSDRHLAAQMQALARNRAGQGDHLMVGQLEVSEGEREARLADRTLNLTTLEFDLLLLLARNRGHILSRDRINREIRGLPHDGRDRSVDLAIVRLRRKLGDDAHHPRFVKTVRGRGYLLTSGVS